MFATLEQLVRLVCMGKWELVCKTCDELFIGRRSQWIAIAPVTRTHFNVPLALERLYHLKAKLGAKINARMLLMRFFLWSGNDIVIRKLSFGVENVAATERWENAGAGWISRSQEANDFEPIKSCVSLIAIAASDALHVTTNDWTSLRPPGISQKHAFLVCRPETTDYKKNPFASKVKKKITLLIFVKWWMSNESAVRLILLCNKFRVTQWMIHEQTQPHTIAKMLTVLLNHFFFVRYSKMLTGKKKVPFIWFIQRINKNW